MPDGYKSFLEELAFSMNEGSCIWYLEDNNWVTLGVDIYGLPSSAKFQQIRKL